MSPLPPAADSSTRRGSRGAWSGSTNEDDINSGGCRSFSNALKKAETFETFGVR